MKEANSGNTSLGHFCGRDLPPHLSSSTRRVHVNFVSDASVAPNGFRMEWAVDGCGGVLRKPAGQISTPNYPAAYPIRMECVWHIVADPGSAIELNVTDFDFEWGGGACLYDGLVVYGGPDLTSPNLTTLCHRSSENVSVTSTGNHMLLRFFSDMSVTGRGFFAQYKFKTGGDYQISKP